ncbi:MAG TPA: hypothetical protein PKM03_12620 [Cyclobacteriaceae bacterium]|nr:hypothetical protein [Cyclobacteriaceae bacterium]
MKKVVFAGAALLFAVLVNGQEIKRDSVSQLVNNTELPVEVVIPVINPKSVIVEAVSATMSKGAKPGFQVDIPEVASDQIEKNLQNSIRNKTKSKVVKTNNEFSVQGTLLTAISDKPLDVYALLTKMDSSVRVVFFFEQDSVFIEESVDAHKANLSREYARTFAVNQYKEHTQNRIKAENNKLESQEKELRKLMDQNQGMHTDIKKLEADINNANMDIKVNVGAQDIKIKEIYKQKELITTIKEKETKKTAEKVLADMNKENKKLRDENESLNKKIVKSRAEIESIKEKIRNNLEDQYLKKQAISKQRGYIRGLEAMVDKIR